MFFTWNNFKKLTVQGTIWHFFGVGPVHNLVKIVRK